MRPNQTPQLLHGERNSHWSESATNRMGKSFCNLPIRQKADIQNLQITKTDLQEKKNKQTHSKVGEGYEWTLFERRHI